MPSFLKLYAPFSLFFCFWNSVILLLVPLMVSYKSCRLALFYVILFSLFSSDWVTSKFLSSNSPIMSSAYSILLLVLCLAFFISFIEFFSSGISVWFLFMISISVYFSFCSFIVFLISLNYLYFFVAH